MGINDNFLRIEKKFAWSFFGFLLAIIFGAFSIYTVYFKDTNPKLDFIIEANTKVLDLKENVRKLDIIYQNENIKESGKNLSIIKIKIVNSSDVNILSTNYDLKDLLGFRLENAEIVEKPEIIGSSNDYIREYLTLNLDSTGNVKFDPIIIDGGESFTLKILALHKIHEIPILKPFGKIAGIRKISVIESFKAAETKSFWSDLKEGTIWVHVVRFFAYLIIIIISMLTIIIPSSLISDSISERKRKRNVRNYRTKKNLPDTPDRNLVYDMYLEFGLDYLNTTQRLFNDERLLKIRLRTFLRRKDRTDSDFERMKEFKAVTSGHIEYVSNIDGRITLHDSDRIIRRLNNENIIKLENNELIVNRQFISDLNEFIAYLKLI